MRLAVFGGSRGVGRQVIEQALAAGHEVRALLRAPDAFDLAHAQLTIVPGNVLEAADVAACIAGAEAVVCSLGNTKNNPAGVVTTGTKQIISAMQAAEVRRLVVVTSIGVGDSADQVPMAFKLLMKTVLKGVMEDKEGQETAVKASNLDWIIIRPGGLTDGPRTGSYKAGMDKSIRAGQVSRADVAEFVLKQLTEDTYLRQTPAIS